MKRITLLWGTFFMACSVFAQEGTTRQTIRLHFRQSKSNLESRYMDNAESLRRIDELLYSKTIQIDSVVVNSANCPLGTVPDNVRYCSERTDFVVDRLRSKRPDLAAKIFPDKREYYVWDRLYQLLSADPYYNNARVLRVVTSETTDWLKKSRIMNIDDTVSYRHLIKHYFPKMRYADVRVVYRSVGATPTVVAAPTVVATAQTNGNVPTTVGNANVERPQRFVAHRDTIVHLFKDTIYVIYKADGAVEKVAPEKVTKMREALIRPIVGQEAVVKEKRAREKAVARLDGERQFWPVALKTNLLYDAASVLNVELEMPIGRHFSVMAEGYFPWWLFESKQRCVQIRYGGIEGRYWFSDLGARSLKQNSMKGWFIGLYGGMGLYDLEWNKTGYQGSAYSGGVTAGYVHKIGREFSMEYSLGLGYMHTPYDKYNATPNGDDWTLVKEFSGKYNWVGPTKLKVSLIWRPSFINKKK